MSGEGGTRTRKSAARNSNLQNTSVPLPRFATGDTCTALKEGPVQARRFVGSEASGGSWLD